MTLSLACKDAGLNCDFKAEASTEEELLSKMAQHAREVHNITRESVDDATLARVKSLIKKV
jgi:predicted small metal-binding protein